MLCARALRRCRPISTARHKFLDWFPFDFPGSRWFPLIYAWYKKVGSQRLERCWLFNQRLTLRILHCILCAAAVWSCLLGKYIFNCHIDQKKNKIVGLLIRKIISCSPNREVKTCPFWCTPWDLISEKISTVGERKMIIWSCLNYTNILMLSF